MATKSEKIAMKAPANSGGFSVGNEEYKPDAKGIAMVDAEHFQHAKSHGWTPVDPQKDAAAEPERDPNVSRPGGKVESPPVAAASADATKDSAKTS